MILAVVLLLLTVGSVLFHFMSPWWWTPIASNWDYIDHTIITFWITGVAFVLIICFVAYCVYRFRHREGQEAHYEPENKRLEWWLTIATSLAVAGLLAPGLVVWKDFVTVPAGASEIEVMGQQWQWNFRLPGKDGVLGKSSNAAVTAENPFGLNKDDPQAQDDIVLEAADLHLPAGKPIKVLLRSKDVLHNFYVPEFRAKMDLIPGMVTYFWFTPTRTAKFDILCFELCGTGHYTMRGSVVVEDDAAYQTWLSRQTAFRDIDQRTKVVTKNSSAVQ